MNSKTGVKVKSIALESPALRGDLKVRDVIKKVNREYVKNLESKILMIF